jgi:predicted nucleotidyltransferase
MVGRGFCPGRQGKQRNAIIEDGTAWFQFQACGLCKTKALHATTVSMLIQDVIATLRQHETDLRARGVRHAALFGSVARGTAGPDSDIDIMIDIEPETVRDVYAYVGLKTYIADLFVGPVDVVDREALRSGLRTEAESDTVYAF